MNITGFISRKKEQFKNAQERARTKRVSRLEERTEILKAERLVREQDEKVKKSYDREKQLKREARIKKFQALKKDFKGFTGGSNVFGVNKNPLAQQGLGENSPFRIGEPIKKKKKIKSKKINGVARVYYE